MNLPSYVHIGVSYTCNIRCRACLLGAARDSPLMEWDVFEKILPLISPDIPVQLFGRGEPLMHPRFIEMVKAVANRGGRAATWTNGTLLSAEMSRQLVEAGLESLTVSVHGGETETHERLQAGVDSVQVWRNVADCAALGIATRVATVVMQSNIAELPMIAHKAAEAGAHAVEWLRLQHGGSLDDEDPFLPERAAAGWAQIEAAKTQVEALGITLYDRLGSR